MDFFSHSVARHLLIHFILPHLPLSDMARAARVNRLFAQCVREEETWARKLLRLTGGGDYAVLLLFDDQKDDGWTVKMSDFLLLARQSNLWKTMALTPEKGLENLPQNGSGVARIQLGRGAYYLGGFKDGLFSGPGFYEMVFNSRIARVQVGLFLEGALTEGAVLTYWGSGQMERREGVFEKGLIVRGEYQFTDAEGRVQRFKGEFDMASPSCGTLFHWNGNRFEGCLKNFRENGPGVFYIKKSGDEIHCDSWKDGLCNGPTTYKWGNGNLMHTQFVDGRVVDCLVSYFDTHGFSFVDRPFKNDVPEEGIAVLPEQLQKCIQQKRCTYSVTGSEAWGQLYWKRKSVSDDGYVTSMQGYCLTCRQTCYPYHHSEKTHEWSLKFSGNFYCKCKNGELDPMSALPCYANP